MKQITKTQAVKDIVKMFGAIEFKNGEKDPQKSVLYKRSEADYIFYFPKTIITRQEVIKRLHTYFEEHKFKDGYACCIQGPSIFYTVVCIAPLEKLRKPS